MIVLEFIINNRANLNQIIIHSFQGDIEAAVIQTDYQWLMFYPCVYMFGIWDGFRDAGGETRKFAYLPFVLGAFFGTVGIIYSNRLKIGPILLGPVWLPMLFAFIGIGIGLGLKRMLHEN